MILIPKAGRPNQRTSTVLPAIPVTAIQRAFLGKLTIILSLFSSSRFFLLPLKKNSIFLIFAIHKISV